MSINWVEFDSYGECQQQELVFDCLKRWIEEPKSPYSAHNKRMLAHDVMQMIARMGSSLDQFLDDAEVPRKDFYEFICCFLAPIETDKNFRL